MTQAQSAHGGSLFHEAPHGRLPQSESLGLSKMGGQAETGGRRGAEQTDLVCEQGASACAASLSTAGQSVLFKVCFSMKYGFL